ncbi:MAG: formylmethanofuran dehydrogenase subunit A [Pirellulaceae bacterium]
MPDWWSRYDPANGIDGNVHDLWIQDGRIVECPPLPDQKTFQMIDVSGRIVMPGGVDMHSHIVGPKVNAGRKMQPELFVADYLQNPSQVRGNRELPTLESTALQYLGMGYTTVFDAAISPLASRFVHSELESFPIIDAGFYSLVGNNHYLLKASANGAIDKAAEFLDWLLNRCRSLAPKIVNPGGVENWKNGQTGTTSDLDCEVDGFGTSPRKIIETIVAAANQLSLPHAVHIHCNNLGMPGNWQTTLETMELTRGQRAHLTHIQFHSYGGTNPSDIRSEVDPLVNFVNANPQLTVDVGQVLFGKTTSMTGDGPLGHFLSQLNGKKWYSSDTEIESGCGVSPIEYRDRNLLNALQWAIGMEWYLKVQNPWQIAMSTDHPNGASFVAYPSIIAMLMDRERRREIWNRLPARLQEISDLVTLDREYSLNDICIITRAAPAKMLGLVNKGHLGVGAEADVCVYTRQDDVEAMFQMPCMVIKSGNVVVHDSELVGSSTGRTLALEASTNFDPEPIENWFQDSYSLDVAQFGVIPDSDWFERPVHRVAKILGLS